jgi:hypothetical protein
MQVIRELESHRLNSKHLYTEISLCGFQSLARKLAGYGIVQNNLFL